ncbi:hypothetical protein [Tenacibaculum singaporense]|uniref:hypothetical protein n=1 Tax=Tenacibaculum singaporense TaxID=2358479 RepID=UPI000F6773C3|nr:hypothetical protein [Tenacibaculum singaporense]RSC93569.1 hypothetical protein EI424_10220 [Tenacibaculum singaporense]
MRQFVLIINIFLSISCFFLENKYLIYQGYLIYLFQFIINMTVLCFKSRLRFNHIFIPSLFSYIFISINLILGGYLVPRGHGVFDKYYYDVIQINNYNLFTPYLLFSLTIFYYLSVKYITKTNNIQRIKKSNSKTYLVIFLFYVLSLFLKTPVAVQLGFLIVFLYGLDKKKVKMKLLFYFIMLILSLRFYSFDKRNIIVVLFLILFFETIASYRYIKLKFKNILLILFLPVLFLFLIITASINRGYGEFEDTSFKSVFSNSIQYIKSDYFIDAITDNLELNYNYGATYVALDYVNNGIIDYQYGLTLIKPLFIFIPRDLYPNKPYSFMHLYTREYQYSEWIKGSSLPVIFPVELFGNFHYLGLIILFFFYKTLNTMYMVILREFDKMNFKLFLSIFFVITHLFFIRGGGIDLYVLYFIFSIPTYYLSRLILLKSN